MFIETNKYDHSGCGNYDSTRIKINTDEISSAVVCGYEHRPLNGMTLLKMKNGEEIYTSLKLEDIK